MVDKKGNNGKRKVNSLRTLMFALITELFLTSFSTTTSSPPSAPAEKTTSGEIRVFISHKNVADPVAAAQAQFERLGMTKTRHRNGVLIFVAPRARKFAVIGDTAVHQRCGDGFWTALAAEMTGHFTQSNFSAGIVHAIQKAGELLAAHFPPQSGPRQ